MILCKRKEIPSIKCDKWNLLLCVISLGAYLEKDALLLYEEPLMKDAQHYTI